MTYERFFWLHVKKSAGQTVRALLSPEYNVTDRVNSPKNFVQASIEEYNDIINNYRILLGEYQFKRCLFAKRFLYGDRWGSVYSFAFSREPISRCISMFDYLIWSKSKHDYGFGKWMRLQFFSKKAEVSKRYAFDEFLDLIERCRNSPSVFRPAGLHFQTHTAAMWDDVTNENGNILLTSVFRLEAIEKGLNIALAETGSPRRVEAASKKNSSKRPSGYCPTRTQCLKIEKLFWKDFDIYENAIR